MPSLPDNTITASSRQAQGLLPFGASLSQRSNRSVPLWQSADTVTLSHGGEEFQFYLPKKLLPEEPAPVSPQDTEETTAALPENPLAPEEENDKQTFAVPGQTTPEGEPLNPSQKMEVAELKQRDKDIRTHEEAHLAAAGSYARSGATYEYKEGPDGKEYAIHGEVMIDSSEEPSPEATISKMRVVRAAALAPASPSPQDLKVSASALRRMVDAVQELRLDKLEDAKKELKKNAKQIEEVEKEAAQQPNGPAQENTTEPSRQEDAHPSLPAPQPQPKFSVNSYKKYTVNVAQYQYDSLALFA